MTIEVRVPALGESVSEATVATWFRLPGDRVEADEMLCELETDKVTVEVPSPAAGILVEVIAAEGATVGIDALLARISDSDETVTAGPAGKTNTAAASAPARNAQEGQDMSGKSVDVMVPTLGESVTEATVATWFKKVGDTVAADEMLCELETDKVSVEVPAPVAGVLAEILADEGATVDAKARLAIITEGAAGKQPSATEQERAESAAAAKTRAEAKSAAVNSPGAGPETVAARDVEDAPSAKKAMAEAGIARDAVQGSGRDGRIMKEDVARAAAAPRAAAPAQDGAREERVKMTRLRQTIARRLKDAQNTAAMLTTYNEADMSGIMGLRNEYKDAFEKKHKVKLGFMSFFVKACCHALNEVPEVNAEIDGTEVVYKNYVNMGVAVGTPSGLVVPVLRDADRKSFAQIEKEIAELGA
ncbi:MAG: biotin/lipoyl-containing protein, partial [Paracoccus sp. (in: a-proteobacteria)]|nr:biotin/lipoyl-containing protein [Paracoccus sp. (in: a-proteobacteria)]